MRGVWITKKIVSGREIAIKDIKISVRRREDMGNIQELADSLKQYGLIHPIVVDDEWNLVAGNRRLEAAKLLGWETIEVRFATELTDKEKRVLELEENIRRKDLTPYEESKNMVELKTVIKEQAEEELRPKLDRNCKAPPGRPNVPGSDRDIEAKTGIPRGTMHRAQKHVQAVEKYPDLKDKPKEAAIKEAKQRDQQKPPAPPKKVVELKPQKEQKVKPDPDITEQQLKDAMYVENAYKVVDELYCELSRRKDEILQAWVLYWKKYGRAEHCLEFPKRLRGVVNMMGVLKQVVNKANK
jgi:hypothetical protein